MAKYPKVRQQHVAVFGESGSGKTVLLSSFYGHTQVGSFKNDLWDLVALQTGQGNRLYANYLGMRDKADVPPADRFSDTTYEFALRLKNGSEDVAKRPFDELRLAWHDYPGEWFERDPSSDLERRRRIETFTTLLKSDVALLLVDGHKLLEHEGEEERYLKALFGNIRQNLVRLKDDLLAGSGPLVEFPRIWVIALSKADLLPHRDVENFRDLVIREAAEDIDRLRSAIAELIDTPDALSIGEDFMLLSSAKFELRTDSLAPTGIDLNRRIGVDLILPVATMLPLQRRVAWQKWMDVPKNVIDSLADGADEIAAALTGSSFNLVAKLFDKVTGAAGNKPRHPVATAIQPLLASAVAAAGPKLKEMNEDARTKGQVLRATLTQFKLDLEAGSHHKVIRTQR